MYPTHERHDTVSPGRLRKRTKICWHIATELSSWAHTILRQCRNTERFGHMNTADVAYSVNLNRQKHVSEQGQITTMLTKSQANVDDFRETDDIIWARVSAFWPHGLCKCYRFTIPLAYDHTFFSTAYVANFGIRGLPQQQVCYRCRIRHYQYHKNKGI